ncbi:MAG: DUF2750 domain-containing protein [Bacteroidetes bacterium]|nr:DUF2750 domain-containing protein [Bacteroidota bacterium]
MNAEEIEKLFKKPGEKRYDLFVKQVAESEVVYGLGDDEGWAMLGDDDDADILPFFQDPDVALAFRQSAEFEEYDVMELDVNELLEWLDNMTEENMLVAVCPNTEFNGAVVEPAMLKADLMKELEKYDEDGKRINQ